MSKPGRADRKAKVRSELAITGNLIAHETARVDAELAAEIAEARTDLEASRRGLATLLGIPVGELEAFAARHLRRGGSVQDAEGIG